MKKILISALATIMFATSVYAGEIDVLPTMQSKSTMQDRVWVGTFQIVWNDLIEKVVHSVVKFPEGTPTIMKELNQQAFSVDDLSENCYYQYTGFIKKNTKKKITKAIAKKFGETSDLLDKLNLTPSRRRILIYAMLKKDFEFASPFEKLGISNFKETPAEFFGINNESDKDTRKTVKVLFYNSPNDFAVSLNTNSKDEVFLYKTSTTKAFNSIYYDMWKKESLYEGEKEFGIKDELKIPNLKFFKEKSFEEVIGKRIKGTQFLIDQAMETVKFEMNNTGVKLKSEAAITVMTMSIAPNPEEKEPRIFNFDDTFVLFLKEKGKNKPYMAIRVYDILNYQN